LWQRAQGGGDDILFTPVGSTNKLSHELELYDPAVSQLVAWVRIPELSASVGNTLYLYYGVPGAANQEDPTNVWINGYVGVWHLNEASGNALDSTAYGYDGTPGGAVTQDYQGQINGAYWFDNAGNGEVNCGQVDALDYETNSFTFSWWCRRDETNAWDTFPLGKGYGHTAASLRGFSTEYRGTLNTFRTAIADADTIRKVYANHPQGAWHYVSVAVNRDSGSLINYVNGGLYHKTSTGISTVTNIASTSPFYIGRDGTRRDWEGPVDEVRLSNGARSEDWILTEYYSQSDPGSFYGVLDEEVKPPQGTIISIW